jgi:hypothetical protein
MRLIVAIVFAHCKRAEHFVAQAFEDTGRRNILAHHVLAPFLVLQLRARIWWARIFSASSSSG